MVSTFRKSLVSREVSSISGSLHRRFSLPFLFLFLTLFSTRLNAQFVYDLTDQDKRFVLPEKLSEVSGLSWIRKHIFACVQDEKGNIYTYDLKRKKDEKLTDFGPDGDYEGIEFVGDTAFVLRSDGQLYEILSPGRKKREEVAFRETFLNGKYDTEGLCYDAETHSLLIACKGIAGEGPEMKNKKAIYRYDLRSRSLVEAPFLLLDLKRLGDSLLSHPAGLSDRDLRETIDPGSGAIRFFPSAIAIHPATGYLYLLSSVGKTLMILDRNGELIRLYSLKPKLFTQPEGIAFEPDGDLLISNEGKGGKAEILKFKVKSR